MGLATRLGLLKATWWTDHRIAMKQFILGLFVCVVATLVLTGCEKQNETPTAPEPPTNAPAAP
jgi:uncharacterized lipoprotein YajG